MYLVKLHFTSGDKECTVLRDGFKLPDDVGAKGHHVTQSCSINIHSAEASVLFLQEESPLINAELVVRSGNTDTVLFSGVVRPYQSVSAKNTTLDKFSLEIMDFTEVMAVKEFEEEYFESKTLGWLVSHVYGLAELSPALSYPVEMDSVELAYKILDPERFSNVAELFSQILFEFGYDYKFEASRCVIFRTWLEDSTNLPVASIINRMRIQRDDNWTDGVKVNYGITGILRQIYLAHYEEDIAELEWWRYPLPWSYSTSSGHVTRTVAYDPFFAEDTAIPMRNPYIQSRPEGFKAEYIIHAMNLKTVGDPHCEILNLTPKAHSIEVEFSWDTQINYVFGNVVDDMPNIFVVGDIIYAIPGDYQEQIVGEKPDEFTLTFVTTTELAKAFAEREYKRAKVAPITYTFQSLTHYDAGSFVRITDTVIGIDVAARILSCSMDQNGIYSVKAESADYLGMSVTVEDLRNRDIIEVGNSLTISADKDAIVEGESVTLTAQGRILSILDAEGYDEYVLQWKLNGVEVPAWEGLKTVTVPAEDLEVGQNTFELNILYRTTTVASASADVAKNAGNAVLETYEQYYISSSMDEPVGSSWTSVMPIHVNGYLWRRIKVIYADGTEELTDPIYLMKVEDVEAADVTTVVEYALSSSPDHYEWAYASMGDAADAYGFGSGEFGYKDIVEWDESYPVWYRGLYVWQRVKVTDSKGNVTYNPPEYCKDLTKSLYDGCKFEITPDAPTWDKNYASSGQTTIGFMLTATNFENDTVFARCVKSVVIRAYKGSGTIPVFTDGIYLPNALHVEYEFDTASDWDRLEAEATLEVIIDGYLIQTQVALCSMSANDITQYDVYGGLFASDEAADSWFELSYGGVADGYSYINTTNKVIMLRRDGVWAIFDLNNGYDIIKAGKVLTLCETDLWRLYATMNDAQKDEAWKNYGYKEQIISRAIATAKLVMYAEGIIASEGISTDPENPDYDDTDDDGFLVNDGYRLEGGQRHSKEIDGVSKIFGAILRATGCYIKDGHFREGEFDNIHVNDGSTFDGSINSTVFRTILATITGSRCKAQSPDATTGAADGVKGSEIKTNFAAWLGYVLSDSHQAAANATNLDVWGLSNVAINGNTGADKVLRFGSVRTALFALKTLQVSSATTAETLSWVNPYPVNIKIKPVITANEVDYEIPSTSISWTKTDDGTVLRGDEPTITNRPTNPYNGQTWIEYADIAYAGGGKYTYNWIEYTATVTTTYSSGTKTGTYTVKIDGVAQSSAGSYEVPSGSTFSVTFSVPNPPAESTSDFYTPGSLVVKWIESENFKPGILFVKNASRSASFYLGDLSDDIWTTGTSLTLTDTGVAVSMPIGVSGSWSYESSYGTIHKLFKFAWDPSYKPSGSGKYTLFDPSAASSLSVVTASGATYSHSSTFNWVEYTQTSAKVNHPYRYGSTRTVELSGTEYYRSFALDFTPIAKQRGIEGMSITPMEDETYDLGSDLYKWNNIRGYHIYSNSTELTSSRKVKEEIQPWEGSALELLAKVMVQSFYFKADRNRKDKYRHIGFIAEDTPAELSTPKKNAMDIGSCIGVLIKGIQELTERVRQLEDRHE